MDNNKENDFEEFLKRNKDFICTIVQALYEIDKEIRKLSQEVNKDETKSTN